MLKRKSYLVLAAAAFATLPVASHAATVTFSYDLADMQVSADGGNTFLPAVFNATTNTVTVPASGDILEFGVDVTVTGDANPAATGTTGAGTYNSKKANQPANLGLGAYGFGMTDSNKAVATVVDLNGPGGNGTTTSAEGSGITGWTLFGSGNVDDSGGGILASGPESAGNNAGAEVTTAAIGTNTNLYGAGGSGPAELLNSLSIQTSTSGTAVFTPSDQVAAGNVGLIVYTSGGSSTTAAGAPKYGNYTVVAGDGNTVNNLPALTVIVAGGPPPTKSIIALTAASGGTPSAYGSSKGVLTVTGAGNGNYNPAFLPVSPAAVTGYVEGNGFTPASDTEIYGLDVTNLGTTAAVLAAEINTSYGSAIASTTFPGGGPNPLGSQYNIYLDFPTPPSADNFLGFDFSADPDALNAGATVTSVALVPEPASIGLLMGASGLLLGRRKRKA